MKKLLKFIGLIFKGIWKLITFIRLALTNLIFIFSLVVIYFLFTSSETPPPEVKQQSALVLNISGPIVEQRSYNNPMDSLTGSLFGQELPKENVLFDIVDTIRHAQEDDQIKGLVLALRNLPENEPNQVTLYC